MKDSVVMGSNHWLHRGLVLGSNHWLYRGQVLGSNHWLYRGREVLGSNPTSMPLTPSCYFVC